MEKNQNITLSRFLGTIVKKSKDTSVRFKKSEDKVQARRCPSCGGARPADSDLRTCDYCGFEFFKSEGEVKISS